MLTKMSQNKTSRFFRMLCLTVFSLLVLVPNYSDLHAFETGDQFVPHNLASRFMRRYKQMGNNEHITYPARVFDMQVTNDQANEILKHLSVTVSYMVESMYNHYGFMVKKVTFTLEANGSGPSESGDPMPFNIALDHGWGMGYANNWLNIPKDWALNPDYTNHGLFHEFAHHFLLRHLDLNDGYYPRSTMDTPGGDVPTTYNRWGGDDLAGAIHMWRYTDDSNVPHCPEFYKESNVGVTGASFPDAKPYPNGTWRCDPDRSDRYGMMFQNKADGRCIEGSGNSNGSNVSLSACNNGDLKQQWDLVADDDGAFRIRNAANNMCMQVKGKSLSSGAIIEQYYCNNAGSEDAAQKFYIIADGSGHYSLRAELSGQVFEVSGNNAIQKKPNGTSTQRWSMFSGENGNPPDPVPDPTPDPGPDSCANACGGKAPGGCWCDSLCESYNDCCPDKQEVCDNPQPTPTPTPTPAPTPTPTPGKSCANSSGGDYCGEKSPDGCWCDSLCESYNDCCPDKQEVCDGGGGWPAGYTWCASEGQSYFFNEKVNVAYGANGKFVYKYDVSGKIEFKNTTFGDPIPGVKKSGYFSKSKNPYQTEVEDNFVREGEPSVRKPDFGSTDLEGRGYSCSVSGDSSVPVPVYLINLLLVVAGLALINRRWQ